MNRAVLFMVMAACAQALVSIIIKGVASDTPISIQVAFYYIVPVLLFLPSIYRNGFSLFKTRKFLYHFIRGFLSFSSVGCFFYAIKYIPLGMSTTLFNMIPFFVPLIAKLFLNEKFSLKTFIGLCIALPGVLLIINPRFSSFSIYHFLIGISSALLMASSMVMLKYLTKEKESINKIVFHQYLSCSLVAILFVALEFILSNNFYIIDIHSINTSTIFRLFGLGGLSIGTQYCFSKAAQSLPVSQFAPFLYLSVPLSSALGFTIWNQSLSPNMIIGSVLIFMGLCICSLRLEKFLRTSRSI